MAVKIVLVYKKNFSKKNPGTVLTGNPAGGIIINVRDRWSVLGAKSARTLGIADSLTILSPPGLPGRGGVRNHGTEVSRAWCNC